MAGELPRRSLQHPARLVYADGLPSAPCLMSDVSPDGAYLSLAEPNHVPEKAELWITPDGKVRRACTIVTRTLSGVGVKFD
jgi:hypothetical protein